MYNRERTSYGHKKSDIVGSVICVYLCKQSSSNSLGVPVTVCTVILNPITFTEIL